MFPGILRNGERISGTTSTFTGLYWYQDRSTFLTKHHELFKNIV